MGRARFVILAAAASLATVTLGGLHWHNQRLAARKLQDLKRQLHEAQQASDAREASEASGGGSSEKGPTDFPLRREDPPAPLKQFLRPAAER